MSGIEHECEDCGEDEAPADATGAPPRRALRGRRVISGTDGDEYQLLVECPLRGVASFEACSACARFKSFSMKPDGKQSFVTCTTDDRHPLPVPMNASVRGRALRTSIVSVMSDPVCVRDDVPITRLAKVLAELGLSGLPVVDAQGRVVGFVTKTDALAVINARIAPLLVGDITSRETDVLPATATLLAAIDLMAEKKRRRLPVVDDERSVVGMISATDVNRWIATSEPGRWSVASPAAL